MDLGTGTILHFFYFSDWPAVLNTLAGAQSVAAHLEAQLHHRCRREYGTEIVVAIVNAIGSYARAQAQGQRVAVEGVGSDGHGSLGGGPQGQLRLAALVVQGNRFQGGGPRRRHAKVERQPVENL